MARIPEDDIRTRFHRYYGVDCTRQLTDGQIPTLRAKWASLSEYVKEIKQSFSRWYNKRHGRKGFFWGERFKSVLVDNGDTLINCLAYIELNPVRARDWWSDRKTTAGARWRTTSRRATRRTFSLSTSG